MRIFTRRLNSLLLATVLISLSSSALAARSYLIELVVFSMQGSGNDEKWTAANPPLNARKMARAKLPVRLMEEFKDEPVEIKESKFSSYVARIQRNPQRNIILSTHWIQTVLGPASTVIARITNRKELTDNLLPDRVARGPEPYDVQLTASEPILDGFINFYLAGQYTLEADIRYTPVYRPSILDEETTAAPVGYRIYEKRRMKSGEVNYFDHPKIGMVLMVTPVEMPDIDSGQKTKD